MTEKRNEDYEMKFRKYLFKGSFERYKKICENINVLPNTTELREGLKNE